MDYFHDDTAPPPPPPLHAQQEDIREHFSRGVDGCMLGRTARDDPFFFARVDAEVFGDEPPAALLGVDDPFSLEVCWLAVPALAR